MYVRLPVLESYIRLCPIADVRLDFSRLQRRGSLACDSHRHMHNSGTTLTPVARELAPAAACQPMPISQTPWALNVGGGLPAIAISLYTTLQAVAANANHDAKRAALDLDLLLILISGAPLNHAGRTQA